MSLEVRIRRTLRDFSLETAFTTSDGVLGILGASGCGKSMTLRCIAGVETPDEGRIVLNGRVLFDSAAGINLPPQQRRVGYLFQSYALFPHMTVEENIACALGREKDRKKRAGDDRLAGWAVPAGRAGEAVSRAAFGRPAAAGRARAHPRLRAGGPAARRALFGAGRAPQGEAPARAARTAARLRGGCGDGDPQPGRGVPPLRAAAHYGARPTRFGGGHARALPKPRHADGGRLTGCKNLCPARKIGEDLVEVPGWGVRFKVVPPVPDDLAYVGIRAHDFHPARPGAENAMRVEVCERVESPFEWYILFRNADGGEGEALWWKFSKQLAGEGDAEYLSVAPGKHPAPAGCFRRARSERVILPRIACSAEKSR